MIQVLLVDDQNIIVEGMSMLLGSKKGIHVIGTASNGVEAIKQCQSNEVDVVLMDIRMPIMDGVEATLKIKEQFETIKIIMLTTFQDDACIFNSLKNGASGYLLKDASPDEIAKAIKEVHEGGTLMNPQVATKVVEKLSQMKPYIEIDKRVEQLTERERDICHLLGEGMNNSEIAKKLFISEGTVKNNITRILSKVELRDRTQLALFSVKNDL